MRVRLRGTDGCNGKDLPEGIYTWVARLEFLDKTVGLFTGDVMLVR
jgi:hypothetical protein